MYYIHMAFDLNSFICKPPFFAKKNKLRESFVNPSSIFRRGLIFC